MGPDSGAPRGVDEVGRTVKSYLETDRGRNRIMLTIGYIAGKALGYTVMAAFVLFALKCAFSNRKQRNLG